jgi:hypothetical protein
MNHPKISLGVTTFLLAIAGVTASKNFATSRIRYYFTSGTTGTGGTCLVTARNCLKLVDGDSNCTVPYGIQHHVTYTKSGCTTLCIYNVLE